MLISSVQPFKRVNNAIGSNMDEPIDNYTKQS